MIIMNKTKIITLSALILIITLGASCGRNRNTESLRSDGGVFKSQDRGQTWFQASSGDKKDDGIENITVKELLFDPQDMSTIFLTSSSGLWLTTDGADSWTRIAPTNVTSLGIDYNVRGVLYMAVGSKLFKSTDAGKNWPEIYNETRQGVSFTDVEVDPHDDKTIWAANSVGELLRSRDSGLSWNVVRAFGDEIRQIIVDPRDRNVIYIGTKKKGIYQTFDNGETWKNLLKSYQKKAAGVDKKGKQQFKNRDGVESFVELVIDPTRSQRLYYLSKYGILRSSNRGEDWEELPLITVPGSVSIFDLQVNNRNSNEIFYTAENVLYHSTNFGAEWFTETVPTSRKLRSLLINSIDPSILYVGTELPPPQKKKSRFFL